MEEYCLRCQGPVDGGVCLICGFSAVSVAAGAGLRRPAGEPAKRSAGHEDRPAPPEQGPQAGRRIWKGVLIGAVAAVLLALAASSLRLGPTFATYPAAVIRGNQLLDLGLQHHQDGEPGKALTAWRRAAAYLERAIALEPSDLQSGADLGLLYYYLGNPPGAVATEEDVLRKDDQYLPALFNLGWIHWIQGNKEAAEPYLNRYLSLVDGERLRSEKYRDQGLIDRQIEAAREMTGP